MKYNMSKEDMYILKELIEQVGFEKTMAILDTRTLGGRLGDAVKQTADEWGVRASTVVKMAMKILDNDFVEHLQIKEVVEDALERGAKGHG